MEERSEGDKGSVRKPVGLLIHEKDPFDGFYHTVLPKECYSFKTSRADVFRALIDHHKPRTIVEVGSYHGASAIHMAGICKALGLTTEIICIDTWQGTVDMLEDDIKKKGLVYMQGHPRLFRQFLANICYAGMQEFITPFPVASSVGLRYLARKGVKADLIYIDGAHEYEEAKLDIALARQILKEGGAMLIDDYDLEGVKQAVDEQTPTSMARHGNQVVLVW